MNRRPPRWRARSRLALLPGLLGLGVLLATAVGCDDTAPQDPVSLCETSADCQGDQAGQVCNAETSQCEACAGDADCAADYGTLATCVEGACVACPDGDTDCACLADETCSSGQGQCIGGTCVDCTAGDLDCTCRANGSCTSGNVCDDASGLCVVCEGALAGAESCPCEGDTCDTGLVCDGGRCVEDTCVDGATDCPCTDEGTCTASQTYCDNAEGGTNLCLVCAADIPGCGCDPGDVCEDGLYCDTTDASDKTCELCDETFAQETCTCEPDDVDQCADGLLCDGDSNSATYRTCRAELECTDLSCGNFECDTPLGGGDAFCCTIETCPDMPCIDGYEWDEDTMMCVEVPGGDPCIDPVTGEPTQTAIMCTDNDQTCVEDDNDVAYCIDTCASLDCAAAFKTCIAATEEDAATCSDCLPGYAVDANDATLCVRDAAANCSTSVGAIGSIYDDCRDRNQVCVEDASGAICGACLAGYEVSPVTALCAEVETCGTAICAEDEYCHYPSVGGAPSCQSTTANCGVGQAWDADASMCLTCDTTACTDKGGVYPDAINGACACTDDVFCEYNETDIGSPRCFVNPCEAGQAHSVDNESTCMECSGLTCGDDLGERPRVWPERDRSGLCMCETQQGYYFPSGGAAKPQLCDADGDGWITETANATYVDAATPLGVAGTDDGRLANFRCERRIIDQVELNNEYGQTRVVALCSDGQIHDYAPGNPSASCTNDSDRVDLVLYEDDSLDTNNGLAADTTKFPAYGARQLQAGEVNSLTKACISDKADYNSNGIEDLLEAQPRIKADYTAVSNGDTSDEGFFFTALSYYTELHTGRYEANAASATSPGTYQITERNRCDTSTFPVTTQVGPTYYWQACLRLRDSDFDYTTGAQVNMDFARFSCDDQTSYCEPLPDPSVLLTGSNVDNWSGRPDRIEDHDLCALREAVAPAELDLPDTPWLGMSHHSQFRCAQITSSSSADHALPRTLLPDGDPETPDPNAQWDFNGCAISDTTPVTDQPDVPQFDCQFLPNDTASVPEDTVGFVAARYAHSGHPTYVRGCIAEANLTYTGGPIAQGYTPLCPGYDENPEGIFAASNLGDYGKLICSCKENYGGANCEVACASRGGDHARLHYGGPPGLVDAPMESVLNYQAEFACDPNNFYCLTYPPVPSVGFLGGRRGYWMCGEFTSTRPAVPGDAPYFEGPYTDAGGNVVNVRVDGNIRMIPVQRSEMTGSVKKCEIDNIYIDCADTCADGSNPTCQSLSVF